MPRSGPLTDEHKQKIRDAHLARGVGQQPKRCPKCHETKPRTEFGRRTNGQSRAACRDCQRSAAMRWQQANPDKVKASNRRGGLKRWFGITVDQYNELLEKQDGRCAVCGSTRGNSRRESLFVDHCHETGVIRGLLCGRCNHGIGQFGDSGRLLRAAAAYVEDASSHSPLVAEPGMPCGDARRYGRRS